MIRILKKQNIREANWELFENSQTVTWKWEIFENCIWENGSIFGKRYLLAIDHIMLAIFWSYVPNVK